MSDHLSDVRQQQLAEKATLGVSVGLPCVTLVLLGISIVTDNTLAWWMLPWFALGGLVAAGVYWLNQHGKRRYTGPVLIGLVTLLSVGVAWSGGIGAGVMVLSACAVILAGVLCGYWCALLIASINLILMALVRTAELQEWLHPTYLLSQPPEGYGTVLLLALVLQILAVASGSLYGLEQTRRQLIRSEQHFTLEKSQLAHRLKQQSEKLLSAETQRMHHIYRLAEVGELSTALMHDLANNLTTLALEIDGIESDHGQASVGRARTQIRQINRVLNRTRQQLKGEYVPITFDAAKVVRQTVRSHRLAAQKSQVTLKYILPASPKQVYCLGEQALFGQLLSNLIHNAIESYEHLDVPRSQKYIRVSLRATKTLIHISVSDRGEGVSPDKVDKIFEPFYTSKETGMGMGLYLTRRLAESMFGGKLELKQPAKYTVFNLTIPRQIKK